MCYSTRMRVSNRAEIAREACVFRGILERTEIRRLQTAPLPKVIVGGFLFHS